MKNWLRQPLTAIEDLIVHSIEYPFISWKCGWFHTVIDVEEKRRKDFLQA
ncbi:hypothetical protein M4S82_04155 [Planococcus sp. MERTA32b]|nr:hypothetical protein [Planococcus sp. MER TA 32b]